MVRALERKQEPAKAEPDLTATGRTIDVLPLGELLPLDSGAVFLAWPQRAPIGKGQGDLHASIGHYDIEQSGFLVLLQVERHGAGRSQRNRRWQQNPGQLLHLVDILPLLRNKMRVGGLVLFQLSRG